jgi:hypothetical protein
VGKAAGEGRHGHHQMNISSSATFL